MPAITQRKWLSLKLDEVSDEGTFKGHASVKGNVDLGKERVMGGAFKKTLSENPSVPILWQHDPTQPIGVSVTMREDAKGLAVEGRLVMDVERAREAHALLKAGAIKGLSIGYDVLRETWEKGIRQLHELKLYEFSIVTFPMNTEAGVSSVKMLAAQGNKFATTFDDANERQRLREAPYRMQSVLNKLVDEAVFGPWDGSTPTDDERTAHVAEVLKQFTDATLAWCGEMRSFSSDDTSDKKGLDVKEGRVLSSRNTQRVRAAFEHLQALLAESESGSEPGEAHSNPSLEGNEAAAQDNSTESEKGVDALILELKRRTSS